MSSLIYMEYYDSDSNMQISDRDSIAIKDIDGYELDTEKAYSIYFDSLNNENKIQIFYKNKIKGSVNVKYIEKNSGEEIQQSKLYDELELGTYDFVAEELENFKLVSDKDISVNLNKENPNQEIEFIYEVNKDKIDINEVPYISTYYIIPENDINDDIKIEYYVTDYNQKEYLYGDTSEEFKVDYWINGEKKTLSNIKAGNNFIDLGKLPEGEYSFDLQVTDKYFRKSHKLFNEFKVVDKEKEDLIQKEKTYSPTKDDLLSKFNIYSDNTNPVETTKGLNDLIQYASKNGYRKVVLPYGIYAIDENNTVKVNVSNITLDLNKSTFKTNPNSNESSLMCKISGNIENSHIINGVLEGDLDSHDYSKSSISEWNNAIFIGGADYSSAEDLVIRKFVGYGATSGYELFDLNGKSQSVYIPNGRDNRVYGDIINGELVSNSSRISTKSYISLDNFLRLGFFYVGAYLGYQGNVTDNWVYNAHFYDENYKYLESVEGYEYRKIKFPSNARYVKFTFLTNLSEVINNSIFIWALHTPVNSMYKNIEFEDIRCVGCAMGGFNNFLVDNCKFSHCGWVGAKCAWDAEDGWDMMQDLTIRQCEFKTNTGNGNVYLNCAGHNFIAEKNINFGGFQYARCRGFVYRNNTFTSDKSVSIYREGIKKSGYFRSYNNIYNVDSVNGIYVNGSYIMYRNSIFNKTIMTQRSGSGMNVKLINCEVNGTGNLYDEKSDMTLEMIDCKLSNKTGTIKGVKFDNCNFYGETNLGTGALSIFNKCTFEKLSGNIYLAEMYNCKITEGSLGITSTNNLDVNKLIFEDCIIDAKKLKALITITNAAKDVGMTFKNCIINQYDNTELFNIQLNNIDIVFNNCIINKTSGYIFSGLYNSSAMKNANVNIKLHLINTKLNSGVSLSKWSDLEGTNIVVTDK